MEPLYLVIRIKGQSGRSPDEEHTLKLLRLHKKFHAVLVRATPSIRGMLKKLEYVVTYGEVDRDTLAMLLRKRGRVVGGGRLTEEYLAKLGFSSYEELADALLSGKVSMKDLPGVKPVFRLTPPSGGFEGTIKKHYKEGGELGYRGPAINELARRMI